ncbi:MAG TPA: LON peptidase substrate-binding domain-containing protein, partial [Myxococcaceae bacterium]|nr:LON peptidase substrate-binding domain-containing protein [Myxococcaceae bacterium]
MRPAPPSGPRAVSVPEIPNNLPILPLRESVLFPLAVMPITVGQERSLRLVDDVMRTSRVIGLVAQRRLQGGPPGPEDLYRVGTAAVIHQLLRNQDGTMQLVVQGLERFRIRDFAQTEPYLIARIEPAVEVESSGDEVEALARAVRSLFERLLALRSDIHGELGGVLEHLGGNIQVAYFVAGAVPLASVVRQEILEADSSADKLRRLVEVLQHEIAVQELQRKITTETTEQISKSQREFMLREQMRTIQRELGESDSQNLEARELRQKVEEANLPPEARKEAERELLRLEQMPPASPEFGIIRTFLEWMISLPWSKTSGGEIDIAKSRAILDEDHYDLEKIKERILDYLAV